MFAHDHGPASGEQQMAWEQREVEEELSTDFCWLPENMVTVPQMAVVEQGNIIATVRDSVN